MQCTDNKITTYPKNLGEKLAFLIVAFDTFYFASLLLDDRFCYFWINSDHYNFDMITTSEESRLNAHLKDLRLETLEKGFPFMLHDAKIASDSFIYEFPDGSMKLMSLADNLQTIVEVRLLTSIEISDIRKKHKLPVFQYA